MTACLGVNLTAVADYSVEQAWADLARSARCFGSPEKSFDNKFGDKIPNENFGMFVYTDVPNMNGTYSVSFNGKCDFSGTGTIQNLKYDAAQNLTTADVTMGAQAMSFKFMNITSPISNISILRPGCTKDMLFNPIFLESLKPYKALRFMDWLRSNANTLKTWAERKLPTDLLQTGAKGVCLEYIAELANQTGKDIWVNVPYQADIDYAKQMAALLKAKLNSKITIYVEWGNEIWNTAPAFPQGNINKDLAVAEVAAGAKDLQLDDPTDTNEWYWARRRVGKKTVEVSKAFREVFGDSEMGNRIKIILPAHAADESKARAALFYVQKYHGVSKHIWGLAIAPYFATQDHLLKDATNKVIGVKPDATVETVLAGCQNSINSNKSKWVSTKVWDGRTQGANHREMADFYGLKLTFYECGQHMDNPVGAELVKKTKLDPRFKNIYKNYFMAFFETNPDGVAFQFADISPWKLGNEFGSTYDFKVDTPQVLALKEVSAILSLDPKDEEIRLLKAQLVELTRKASDLTAQVITLQTQVTGVTSELQNCKIELQKALMDLQVSRESEAKLKKTIAAVRAAVEG